MKTNPDDYAFPTAIEAIDGLTKREYFAALAMQGMLANNLLVGGDESALIARDAAECADQLIAELNKEAQNA